MKVAVVIPARIGSTRLPGKPLLHIAGREMILHVAQRAGEAEAISEVIVATDDERIENVVEKAGFRAVRTSPGHVSGTDRCAEAAAAIDADLIVNLQGDEPLFPADLIDKAVAPFASDGDLLMGTLRTRLRETAQLFNPNCVKVVTDNNDVALYFSRSPIPFFRDGMNLKKGELRAGDGATAPVYYKHIGMYVYRKDFLMRFATMPPGRLEQAEKLEQLRALEAGVRIMAPAVESDTISVDTTEDLERVRSIMEGRADHAV